MQGRRHLARLTPEAFAKARQHFEEAIAHDPTCALAYDSLAEIYWYLGYVGYLSPQDAFSTGVLYAMRALEIDNTLGEPHALLALYHKQVDYNWPEVDRAMTRALEPAYLRFTSGTTSERKGVILSHRRIAERRSGIP